MFDTPQCGCLSGPIDVVGSGGEIDLTEDDCGSIQSEPQLVFETCLEVILDIISRTVQRKMLSHEAGDGKPSEGHKFCRRALAVGGGNEMQSTVALGKMQLFLDIT